LAHDAFISYSSEDKAAADAACAALETAGIRCWIAPRDISPGAEWGAAIVDAIDHSAVMVLIFSSNANESRQIRREVEHAVSKGVTIVPVRIDQSEPMRSLAYFMAGVHWLDALAPPLENHLQRLATSMKAFLRAAPADPSTEPGQMQPSHAFPSVLERPAGTTPGAIPERRDDVDGEQLHQHEQAALPLVGSDPDREKQERPRGRRTSRRQPPTITPEGISAKSAEEQPQRPQEVEGEQLRQLKQALGVPARCMEEGTMPDNAKPAAERSYQMGNVGAGARVAQGENISWVEGVASLPSGDSLTRQFDALLKRIADDASLDEDTRVLAQEKTKAIAEGIAKVQESPTALRRALLDAKSWFGVTASWVGGALGDILKSEATQLTLRTVTEPATKAAIASFVS
jgi:hypothetical protein